MHQKLIEKGRKSLKEKLYVYRNIEGVFHFRRLVLQSIIDNLRTMIFDRQAYQKCNLQAGFAPCRGLSVLRTVGGFSPPFGFPPTAQHCNVYNFCNLAIFKSAIPRLQNSNTLHCCAVTFLRHCLILSSSQYHVLFIRFARTPNSFFAFPVSALICPVRPLD